MKRIIGVFLLFASVVLLAGVAYAWRRSYRVSDGFAWVDPNGQREVASYAGAVHVKDARQGVGKLPSTSRARLAEPVAAGTTWRGRRPFNEQVLWERGGFVFASGSEMSIFPPSLSLPAGMPGGSTYLGGSTGTTTSSLTFSQLNLNTASQTTGGSGAITLSGGTDLFPLTTHQVVVVPYWAIGAIVGLPAWWFVASLPWRVRRWRRRLKGLCLKCGYDLRHSPDRCPECGTAP